MNVSIRRNVYATRFLSHTHTHPPLPSYLDHLSTLLFMYVNVFLSPTHTHMYVSSTTHSQLTWKNISLNEVLPLCSGLELLLQFCGQREREREREKVDCFTSIRHTSTLLPYHPLPPSAPPSPRARADQPQTAHVYTGECTE